ncbi:hypothetical protein RUND412_009067 [Rhizina undulata]
MGKNNKMLADEEVALVIVFANLLSALWSYFCISASLDRRSRAYDLMHDTELVWNAVWYSCQTYALLVSVTNIAVVSLIAYRLYPSFLEIVKSQPQRSKKALVAMLGITLLIMMFPASFAPYKITLINTSRGDENVFIHCMSSKFS